jgi:hypothetical protein
MSAKLRLARAIGQSSRHADLIISRAGKSLAEPNLRRKVTTASTSSISMTVYPLLSLWILVLTAATLFWVALTDLSEFKVRNELVVVLVCLYLLHTLCSGSRVSMQWNLAFALLMLLAGAYAYSLRQIGGGDLKLLAVACL